MKGVFYALLAVLLVVIATRVAGSVRQSGSQLDVSQIADGSSRSEGDNAVNQHSPLWSLPGEPADNSSDNRVDALESQDATQPPDQPFELSPPLTDQPQTEQPVTIPLDDGLTRVTQKPFGIQISPNQSPIQPERFSGFHTGIDLEVSQAELQRQIVVQAICDGTILYKDRMGGYGNVMVQSCALGGYPVTVLYGHLASTGFDVQKDDTVKQGQSIAYLGDHQSLDTDGERKHLHLAIHKGAVFDLRGYVTNPGELSLWVDPAQYLMDIARSRADEAQ